MKVDLQSRLTLRQWRKAEEFLKIAGLTAFMVKSEPDSACRVGGFFEVSAEVCRFDDFELDPSAHRLRRKGRAVHLEPIPFRLLCLLVERHGQLVTREKMLERMSF